MSAVRRQEGLKRQRGSAASETTANRTAAGVSSRTGLGCSENLLPRNVRPPIFWTQPSRRLRPARLLAVRAVGGFAKPQDSSEGGQPQRPRFWIYVLRLPSFPESQRLIEVPQHVCALERGGNAQQTFWFFPERSPFCDPSLHTRLRGHRSALDPARTTCRHVLT